MHVFSKKNIEKDVLLVNRVSERNVKFSFSKHSSIEKKLSNVDLVNLCGMAFLFSVHISYGKKIFTPAAFFFKNAIFQIYLKVIYTFAPYDAPVSCCFDRDGFPVFIVIQLVVDSKSNRFCAR